MSDDNPFGVTAADLRDGHAVNGEVTRFIREKIAPRLVNVTCRCLTVEIPYHWKQHHTDFL